jgi:hypothetical protein
LTFITAHFQFITAHFVYHCTIKNALLDLDQRTVDEARGAPTGKTETTKDLAEALCLLFIVTNCREAMDCN